MISAAANLPGNFYAWALVDRWSRKFVLTSSAWIAGGSIFGVLSVTTVDGVVAFSAIMSGISAGIWNALDILAVEAFPTR